MPRFGLLFTCILKSSKVHIVFIKKKPAIFSHSTISKVIKMVAKSDLFLQIK